MKFPVIVGDNGFPVNYVVTPVSVHDSQIAYELLISSPFSIIHGDKGYVTKSLKERLLWCGIRLMIQLSENMSNYSRLEHIGIQSISLKV
ncbi:transposase [Streptococcus sp. 121]|nr:transposase [Streptococcus sp. 121]